MPPIRKGDGTPVTPKGISQIRTGDGRILFDGVAIPDSRVERPADNETNTTTTGQRGIVFTYADEWEESFQGRISQDTTGVTRAEIYRNVDGTTTLIGSADISGLTSGDVFTVQLDELIQANEDHVFLLDAEGSEYDQGLFNDPAYPYTSDDGDLSIVGGAVADDDFSDAFNAAAISEIGNIE